MSHINLLPWRENKRAQEKKRFVTKLIISALIGLLIVFFAYFYMQRQIANQIIRNQLLNQVIKVYDQQITEIKKLEKIRNLLIFRIRFLENIQFSRVLIIHLFDELSKITPPGVYLTRIKGKNNIISISGYTQSSVFISREMKSIQQNEWLHNPVLNRIREIENENGMTNNQFELTVALKPSIAIREAENEYQ